MKVILGNCNGALYILWNILVFFTKGFGAPFVHRLCHMLYALSSKEKKDLRIWALKRFWTKDIRIKEWQKKEKKIFNAFFYLQLAIAVPSSRICHNFFFPFLVYQSLYISKICWGFVMGLKILELKFFCLLLLELKHYESNYKLIFLLYNAKILKHRNIILIMITFVIAL